MVRIVDFVDEELEHSSYLIDLGDCDASVFDGGPDKPNKRGLALITYVQWLGSWLDSYPYYEELESITSEGY